MPYIPLPSLREQIVTAEQTLLAKREWSAKLQNCCKWIKSKHDGTLDAEFVSCKFDLLLYEAKSEIKQARRRLDNLLATLGKLTRPVAADDSEC